MALSWKLLVAPLAMLGLGLATGVGGLVLTIGVLQAAMAPIISAVILCDPHHLEPPLADIILGKRILLSLLTGRLGITCSGSKLGERSSPCPVGRDSYPSQRSPLLDSGGLLGLI